jgi:integrase
MELTKTAIDELRRADRRPAKGKRVTVYDCHPNAPRGFGVRITDTGAASYFYEHGPAHKRQRVTIGTHGQPWTVQTARKRANDLKGQPDPAGELRRQKAIPTWRDWVAEYLAALDKKSNADRYYLQGTQGGRRKDGKPEEAEAMKRWGGVRLDKITPQQVEALRRWVEEQAAASPRAKRAAERHPDVRPGVTSANRWLAAVRACFAAAERAGLIGSNPAVAIRPRRENPPRARFLSDPEHQRLAEAVAKLANDELRVLLTLMMTTGCRQSEARRARWQDLDVAGASWTIPSPKAGRPQTVPLPPAAVRALRSLRRRSEYVFPSPHDPARPLGHLRRPWERLLQSAELPADINAHDLRRTFCRRAVDTVGRDVASKLLRHSDSRITDRVYNPRTFAELLEATRAINRDDDEKEGGEVVAFPVPSGADR